MLDAGVFQIWRRCSTTIAHRALPVREWPALSIPWTTARSNAVFAVCSRFGGVCTGCCGRAGQMILGEGDVELLNAGVFQVWRHRSATTAHRALPVRDEWPIPGMPWQLHCQMQLLQCAADVADPALGAETGWADGVGGCAVLLNAGVFQMLRRRSTTTAHRALPVW